MKLKIIFQRLVAYSIVMGGYIALATISITFAHQSGNLTVPNPLGGTGDITSLITKIAWWIYDLAFILAFIMLAYGGIQFIISSGEPAKTKKAKETIVNALIGIAIILIGRGFITLVQSIISGPGPTS